VGDVKITDTDKHGIPQWIGIVAIVGGVVLVGAGAMAKRS
jgi:drug/metabolite transporter (DMT)-like permease